MQRYDIPGATITMETSGTVVAGQPVKMVASTDDTVSACSDKDKFIGFAVKVESDGNASVQLNGRFTATYSGTAPSRGWTELVATADGKVRALTSAEMLIALASGAVADSAVTDTSVTDRSHGVPVRVLGVDTSNSLVSFVM